MPKTAIIILHYGKIQYTLDCLSSLNNEIKKEKLIHTIVVANSDNGIRRELSYKYPEVELINNENNQGFSQGNNIGMKRALQLNCENIILINNDAEVQEGLIQKLSNYISSNTQIGLISPKVYFYPGNEYYPKKYTKKQKGKVIWYAGGKIDWNNCYASHAGVDEADCGQYDKISETDFATGCCMAIHKSVIEKIGLLDEKYFLYYEDVDFSIRAKRAGFKVVYFPESHLWHKNAASSGKPGSPLHIYYQTRNRIYFGFKYAHFRTKKSLFFESIKNLLIDNKQSQAIKDYYLGNMGRKSL